MAKRSQSKGPSGSTALSHLGVATGALAGVLVYEGLGYFYHRSMHASDLLWRGLHQMHHSAERIDTWSAFWFHPFDMIGWTAMSSLALTLIVGLSPPRRRLRCSSSRCCRSSSTPTCAPRAGLATSSSVPKAIPGTTRAGGTATTMPTCHCSTSCSALSTIHVTSPRRRDSTTAPRRAWPRCCCFARSR